MLHLDHVTQHASPADVSQPTDLTQHEILALTTRYNLADAHTHQAQSSQQRGLVARLPELWYDAERGQQAHFERRFVETFFRLHGQPTAAASRRSLLSYAASVSTLVAGIFLRQRRMSVTLIEPCFDNLADVLRNLEVPLSPLPEELLVDPERIYANLVQNVETEALFLVDPNNPTGFSIARHGRRAFEEVIRFCVDHERILIIDFCFAAFGLAQGVPRFDVYRMLEDSGVTYMTIEDTGKIWPIQDAKCAMLTVSASIWDAIRQIHTSILLNVSPFVLNMVSQYIETSIGDGLASVRDIVTANRTAALSALDGTLLIHQRPMVNISVAWFRIASATVTATELQDSLTKEEIYVLPGTYFYWSEPARGEHYVRIALARRPDMFAHAMTRLRRALNSHVL